MSEILTGEGDMVARVERTVDRAGSPNSAALKKGDERHAPQLAESAAQAVEELARKAMQLAESMALHQLEVRRREASADEVLHLKGVVATAELSVEEYARTCAALATENEEMKKQVRDFKNQLLCSRLIEEQLVDANSKLVTQAADANEQLRANKAAIEDLTRDVKSYELLQKSNPSYMYAEVMAQARIGLQDENSRLQSQVYLLSAKTGKYSSSNESQLEAPPTTLLVAAAAPEETLNLAALVAALPGGVEMPEGEVEEMLAAPLGALPRSTTALPV